MELVGHGIRVNSLTPTATDPSESFERAARWGRTVKKPEKLDRLMKPFRDGIPMKSCHCRATTAASPPSWPPTTPR
jgi:hypothetical protein